MSERDPSSSDHQNLLFSLSWFLEDPSTRCTGPWIRNPGPSWQSESSQTSSVFYDKPQTFYRCPLSRFVFLIPQSETARYNGLQEINFWSRNEHWPGTISDWHLGFCDVLGLTDGMLPTPTSLFDVFTYKSRRAGYCSINFPYIDSRQGPSGISSLLDVLLRPPWGRRTKRRNDGVPRGWDTGVATRDVVRNRPPFRASTKGYDLPSVRSSVRKLGWGSIFLQTSHPS